MPREAPEEIFLWRWNRDAEITLIAPRVLCHFKGGVVNGASFFCFFIAARLVLVVSDIPSPDDDEAAAFFSEILNNMSTFL